MAPETSTKEELIALAERCEQADGPDRELDAAIRAAIGSVTVPIRCLADESYWNDPAAVPGSITSQGHYLPPYTASIDAALTLVPEGHNWAIELSAKDGFGAWCFDREVHNSGPSLASTAALALCAAALRSRGEG